MLVKQKSRRKFKQIKRFKKRKIHKTNRKQVPKFIKWFGVRERRRLFFVLIDAIDSFKEAEISRHLDTLKIRYYREISFDAIKRFDFYLPDYDLVIEYDGKQHDHRQEKQNDIKKNNILKRINLRIIRYNRFSGKLLECLKRDLLKTDTDAVNKNTEKNRGEDRPS